MSESPRETVRVHWRCLASRFAANRRAWHLTGSALENGPCSLEVPGIPVRRESACLAPHGNNVGKRVASKPEAPRRGVPGPVR